MTRRKCVPAGFRLRKSVPGSNQIEVSVFLINLLEKVLLIMARLQPDHMQALQNIIDRIVAILDFENQVIEELLLDEDSEDDDDLVLNFRERNAEMGDIANVIQNFRILDDAEEFFHEDDTQVAKTPIFKTNIEQFRVLDDPTFQQHFRMDRNLFERLVLEVGHHMAETNRLVRVRTGIDVCLLMTLWILGNLSTFRETGVVFGVSRSVVHFHYVVMIEVLRELACKFIKWPSRERRNIIKQRCLNRTGLPGVVGMMDGSLIKITAPSIQREQYFDRHHSYSLNVLGVCDDKLIFTHVYLGEPGRVHDARIFKRSPLSDLLLERQDIVGEDEHLLGDKGYMLTNKVMIPYRDNGRLTRIQRRFNYIQSSLRMPIERAWGHLKQKNRRLYRLQVKNFDIALDHVMASIVIHNFILLRGVEPVGMQIAVPERNNDGPQNVEREHPLLGAARAEGRRKRDALALLLQPNE